MWKGDFLKAGVEANGMDINVFQGNVYARNLISFAEDVWYVDSSVSSSGNGKTWRTAFKTIQEGVDQARSRDAIVCRGSSTESVQTRDYDASLDQNYVSLIGVPGSLFGQPGSTFSPYWEHSAGTSPCLSINALGWNICGFRFYGEATDTKAAIRVHCFVGDDDTYDAATYAGRIAIRTTIAHCHFWGGLYGIDFLGAPYECNVLNNYFQQMHTATNSARCIINRESSYAIPYRYQVIGNYFLESDGYIDWNGGTNGCFFVRNMFQGTSKAGYNADPKLDFNGVGVGNMICNNYLGDTYDNAGGYYADAGTGNWYGNACEDGFSTADPAA